MSVPLTLYNIKLKTKTTNWYRLSIKLSTTYIKLVLLSSIYMEQL